MGPLIRQTVGCWKNWQCDREEESKAKSDLQVIVGTNISKRLLSDSESHLSLKTSEAVRSKAKFLNLLELIKSEKIVVPDIRLFLETIDHKEDLDSITLKVI